LFESILNKFQLRFKDRVWAANVLAESLKDVMRKGKLSSSDILVLGIPRGGVITAEVISQKLNSSFDIIIPRKLRAPHNKELAIGAITEDGTTYLIEDLIRTLEIPVEYIEKEKTEQIEEIKRRSSLYRNKSESDLGYNIDIDNTKTVILADDGAATGATLIAAARWIRKNYNPNRLIIAVPVATKDTVGLLKKEANHVEVIMTPSTFSFRSVGQYYQNFGQITDEQVIEIMKKRTPSLKL
jgi:putative phosphoribosyl transferase